MADYMQWNESDRYHHLCACLDGVAGQILWDVGPDGTVAKITALLRTRFGNELQSERFRAELKGRHRQPREPLQQLYLDVSRLVTLAYPGKSAELCNHVAKEAFVEALGDPQLQLKVLEKEPKTVEDALAVATRMEAYAASVVPRQYDGDGGDRKHKQKFKSVYAVEGKKQSITTEEDGMALLLRRMRELQTECSNTKLEIERVKTQKEEAERKADEANQAIRTAKTSTPPASDGSSSNQGGSGQGQYRNQGNYRGRGRGRSQPGRSGACHKCGQHGHWANECPNPPAPISAPAPTPTPQPPPSAPAPASGTQAVTTHLIEVGFKLSSGTNLSSV